MKRPTYPDEGKTSDGRLVGGSVPDQRRNEDILTSVRQAIKDEAAQLPGDETEIWNLLGRLYAVANP